METQGIWKYRELRNHLNFEKKITLGEGNVPIDNFQNIKIIREDLNPSGSWKDRGTAWKLTELLSKNIHEAVISSSGNAAISLIKYCNELNLDFKLHIVLSTDVNEKKRELIYSLTENTPHQVYFDKIARKKSSQIAAQFKIPLLRASADNEITKGYWSLGFEIFNIIKNHLQDNWYIFCPVSSGTGFVGIAQGLYMKIEDESKMPHLIACQTESVNAVVQALKQTKVSETPSLADAIVDKTVLRLPQILKAIDTTSGYALAITNAELEDAKSKLMRNKLDLSYTSLLSIAGYFQTKDTLPEDSKIICIASGR